MQRRAKRSPVVTGGRLHVDFVEQTGAGQLSIRAAIESHPARHRDFAESGGRAKMAADVENRAIQRRLKRCGNVAMGLRDLSVRLAKRYEVSRQPVARLQIVFAVVPGAVQTENWNSNCAVSTAFDNLLKNAFKLPRVAVWREPHDLVFVGIEIEAEMIRYQRVDNTERIVRRNFTELFQFSAIAVEDRSA